MSSITSCACARLCSRKRAMYLHIVARKQSVWRFAGDDTDGGKIDAYAFRLPAGRPFVRSPILQYEYE